MFDIASLFSARPSKPSQDVRFRQGTIVSWDNLTLENVIDVGGTELSDLPVLGLAEVATYEAGDVVGILVIGNEDHGKTYAVIGQITAPDTPAALSALSFLAAFIQTDEVSTLETTNSTSATDLATVGPEVTVRIGPSGLAIVFVSAEMFISTSTNGTVRRALSGYTISGATTRAFTTVLVGAKHQESAACALCQVGRYTAVDLCSGLTAGNNTFKMQYLCSNAADQVGFGSRQIIVFPL